MSEFQEGEGLRACKDFDELTKYNPINVYMTCLACNEKWYLVKSIWEESVPVMCPVCSAQAISHEYSIPNSIPARWRRVNSSSPLKIVPIEDPVRGTLIKRIVRVQSII